MPSKLAKLLGVHGLYRHAARVAHRLPLRRGAAAESIAGRRSATGRWRAWAAEHADSVPLAWFHAASVGEAQAAAPIMRRLRAARRLRIVLTYSSPSMARWPGYWPADNVDYVPLDEPAPLQATFEALDPRLLCFCRGDLWPELIETARACGIPIAVASGTIREGSRRHRWPGRLVLGQTHRALSYVGAVTEADRQRWIRAGVPDDRVIVTGDSRHDAIVEREVTSAAARALRTWRRPGSVLVAGSTEREDLGPVTDGLAAAAGSVPGLRALMVPHDSRGAAACLAACGRVGLRAAPWAGPPSAVPDAAVLVVTAVGLLADLYLAGDMAYVGGGFRRGGLHSVAEAAAFALPVVTGPWCDMDTPGVSALPHRDPARAFARVIESWSRDRSIRDRTGMAARRGLTPGASGREVQYLLKLLDRP